MLKLAAAKTIHSCTPWVSAKQLMETETIYLCRQVKKSTPPVSFSYS